VALARSAIDSVIFYGPATNVSATEAIAAGFDEAAISFADSMDDVKQFLRQARLGDAVLVKGSRSLELERALEMENVH
jgi:UDP-N-acetylmuramyl pentapeptide synthase